MTEFTRKREKKKRNNFPKSISIIYNIKSADKVPGSQYFYWTYIFFPYFEFYKKNFPEKKKTE